MGVSLSPDLLICLPGRCNCEVDILLRSGHCLSKDLFGGGIDDIKELSTFRIDVLSVDEEFGLDFR